MKNIEELRNKGYELCVLNDNMKENYDFVLFNSEYNNFIYKRKLNNDFLDDLLLFDIDGLGDKGKEVKRVITRLLQLPPKKIYQAIESIEFFIDGSYVDPLDPFYDPAIEDSDVLGCFQMPVKRILVFVENVLNMFNNNENRVDNIYNMYREIFLVIFHEIGHCIYHSNEILNFSDIIENFNIDEAVFIENLNNKQNLVQRYNIKNFSFLDEEYIVEEFAVNVFDKYIKDELIKMLNEEEFIGGC